MVSTFDGILIDLASTLALRNAADSRINELREAIRGECDHPLVIQGRERQWIPRRVCVSCGSAEVGFAGDFHLLAKPGRVVVTTSEDLPELDDPNVQVTFFSWCREDHFEKTRRLPYGWCEEHMPESIQEMRRRDYAREAYYNSPG